MTATVQDISVALRAAGVAEVLTDDTHRAAYSSDASLYRVVPRAVVRARHQDEIEATLAACRALGVPVTPRGAGTSIAGNAVGSGVVLDLNRHLNRVLAVDRDTRTARVQAGTVHATLQAAARPLGLRFGPDPSSHSRCTIGGMIGNNACGTRALGYGRTSDNVAGLRALTIDGSWLTAGRDGSRRPTVSGPQRLLDELRTVVGADLATARTEFARFGRQVSGYALDSLLPERGFDVAGLVTGAEGTLAVVTEATVDLVRDPAHRLLVVLGFPDIGTAGDAVPIVLRHRPTACEGMDARIVDVLRDRRGPAAVPPLPTGAAWLFVEIADDDAGSVVERASGVVADADAVDSCMVTDLAHAAALWRIREDGAGLAARAPSGLPAHAGWEDAAVPPVRIGEYLRAFDDLVAAHGLTSMPYGHLGDGCVHVRLDFPLDRPGGTARFRAFLTEAADLVVGFGGSLSGEHGDGRARSELLPRMYSPAALQMFRSVKRAFDPDCLLNPGVLVDPAPVDAAIRVAATRPVRQRLALAYAHDGGDFGQAVHRCTGVGKCLAGNASGAGVMCPSYLATRDEKDTTRGRARVLQEMLDGDLVVGWRSPAVHDALDLCLSCKGCASDCPTGTDMASYKAEVLYQTYRRRLRPRTHYSLGWLPRWSRLAVRAPRLSNRLTGAAAVRRLTLFAAGVDARRAIPAFAPETFRQWYVRTGGSRSVAGAPVVLFVDSFTDHFAPEVGRAAVVVLRSAGYAPVITERSVCCGLTWITTGQLDAARRILRRTVASLEVARSQHASEDRMPIVGLEPSCTAVLRGDLPELLDTIDAQRVSAATTTIAELLSSDPSWQPPSLAGMRVLAQPHCHHHAVMGWDTDARLLARAGAQVSRLAGCCGLAGNFGVERGHYDISVAVAAQHFSPAVAAMPAETVLLADGFSCRTQAADLHGVRGVHLAELLAEGVRRSAGADSR